jgi:hypothetical protein
MAGRLLNPQMTALRSTLAGYVGFTDTNARLSAGPTESATGIEVTITGGWTADVTDCPRMTWALRDMFGGVPLDTTDWHLSGDVWVRTHPGNSTDTAILLLLTNEADLESATVDGCGAGIRWGGASRQGRCPRISNGTQADANENTASTSIEGGTWNITRTGQTASAQWGFAQIGVFDSSGAALGGSITRTAGGLGFVVGSPGYLHLVFQRTATTAGSVTVKVDPFVAPILQVPHGV